jgi:peptidoglycan/xylan/chitin deacetylase (PgdA/CDA1 family)
MSFEGEQRSRPRPPRDRRPAPAPPRKRTPRSRVAGQRAAALGALVLVAVVVIAIVHNSSSSTTVKANTTASVTHPSTTPSTSTNGGTTSRSNGAPGTASVPILVYHVINTQPDQSTANPALYVPADEFSSQMQALKADGWHAVTLNQVAAYWARGTSLGTGKPIVITFDNGYASHYVNALPVLKRLGWVGVENLPVTGLPPSDGGLSETQVRALIAGGWELDCQGLTTAPLSGGDPTRLTSDLSSARQTLRSRYGVPVNWFAYPSGSYDDTVVAAVRAAGYVGATTLSAGWAGPQQDRFRLPRLEVAGGTTPTDLLTQISSAKATTSAPPTSSGPVTG